jgi:hypothetical protein
VVRHSVGDLTATLYRLTSYDLTNRVATLSQWSQRWSGSLDETILARLHINSLVGRAGVNPSPQLSPAGVGVLGLHANVLARLSGSTRAAIVAFAVVTI